MRLSETAVVFGVASTTRGTRCLCIAQPISPRVDVPHGYTEYFWGVYKHGINALAKRDCCGDDTDVELYTALREFEQTCDLRKSAPRNSGAM